MHAFGIAVDVGGDVPSRRRPPRPCAVCGAFGFAAGLAQGWLHSCSAGVLSVLWLSGLRLGSVTVGSLPSSAKEGRKKTMRK